MNNVEDVKVLEAVENVGGKMTWQTGVILGGTAVIGGLIDRFVVPAIVKVGKNLINKVKTSKDSKDSKKEEE